jgi:hypothetical protein
MGVLFESVRIMEAKKVMLMERLGVRVVDGDNVTWFNHLHEITGFDMSRKKFMRISHDYGENMIELRFEEE